MRRLDKLFNLVTRETDARAVAIVRMVVGLAAIGFALETWMKMARVLDPMIVKMPYVAWFPRIPAQALPIFVGVWLSAALAFTLGLRARLSGAILTAAMAYALFFDQQLYSNHLYLITIVLLLLTIADSGACFSLDARRSGGRERIRQWPIVLLKWQVSIVYFYAAILKVNPQYLSGATMRGFWPLGELTALPGGWSPALLLQALAVLSILTELFLAAALWLPRVRWLALVVGIGFHLTIMFTGGDRPGVPDIAFTIFAMVTVAPYALFFDFPPRRVAAESYSG
jgi:hypothetical protein